MAPGWTGATALVEWWNTSFTYLGRRAATVRERGGVYPRSLTVAARHGTSS